VKRKACGSISPVHLDPVAQLIPDGSEPAGRVVFWLAHAGADISGPSCCGARRRLLITGWAVAPLVPRSNSAGSLWRTARQLQPHQTSRQQSSRRTGADAVDVGSLSVLEKFALAAERDGAELLDAHRAPCLSGRYSCNVSEATPEWRLRRLTPTWAVFFSAILFSRWCRNPECPSLTHAIVASNPQHRANH
jgi:hypothetical protein